MNKKGVSAVIATVIIVAVTISLAVMVAYWMGNIHALRYARGEIINLNNGDTFDVFKFDGILYVSNGSKAYLVMTDTRNNLFFYWPLNTGTNKITGVTLNDNWNILVLAYGHNSDGSNYVTFQIEG